MEDPFPAFHKAYPPGAPREAYDPLRHDAFAARVPAALVAEWRTMGFGPYGVGLLWTVAPDRPVVDHSDWAGLDGTGIDVLRSAFADVCLWQGGRFVWLNIHTGTVTAFSARAGVMFDAGLIEPDFRKSVLLERLFKVASKRFGKLGREECFGFAPFPSPWDTFKEEDLTKAPMREYVEAAAHVVREARK